ncbi:oligoendopeptidase F [Bacillus coahuilensis m2-6]|uniref:M3 family oligoendopeptidase n=1 Tax=Bacillus coahuilensis TaxID=408580 RepID=UPI0007506E54|nr:M3 family oligoendopeptidase [Bacillus coahuilensis]KUP08906.1 oligoendopeptidase F [Bacillus coahuilensis m2-6]
MKFSEYTYERPNMEEISKKFAEYLNKMTEAQMVEEVKESIHLINELRNDFGTMYNICYIRHSINTADEFFQTEQDYMDEIEPEIEALVSRYYHELVTSSFRKQLEMEWGEQLFSLAEAKLKTYSDEVLPLLKEENRLSSKYTKLISSAKIDFDGNTYTLAQLAPFSESKDQEIRKAAIKASSSFFQQNEVDFDQIFEDLVIVRTKIAKALGFSSFVELGYYRMMRTDYTADMVKVFREEVKKHVVPIVSSLKEKQRSRIGLDKLNYYDEAFQFKSGNSAPKGDPSWIISNGKDMYGQLSRETGEFFNILVENELLDVEAKKGKAPGGYCTYIENYQVPYIFSNFNGTAGDIDVLTHEAGHAFQVYRSRHFTIPEYNWPTYEACEIHSMSMEFFTWPWMEKFFKEDKEKYYYSHLTSGLIFLPYGVLVDEFQHEVYENPEWSKEERKACWRRLEKQYLPHRNYGDDSYLEGGGYWHRQTHIFNSPFYYIDYTLAQVCAYQYWDWSQRDFDAAWRSYLHLCDLGGSKSFTNLVEEANLSSPFEENALKSIMKPIEDWLQLIDDSTL